MQDEEVLDGDPEFKEDEFLDDGEEGLKFDDENLDDDYDKDH